MGFLFTLPILLIDRHRGNIIRDLTHKPSQVSDWLIFLFLIGQLKTFPSGLGWLKVFASMEFTTNQSRILLELDTFRARFQNVKVFSSILIRMHLKPI